MKTTTIIDHGERKTGEVVRVLIAERRHAKAIKERLKADRMIHRDFKITNVDKLSTGSEDDTVALSATKREQTNDQVSKSIDSSNFVAIPILSDEVYEQTIVQSDQVQGIQEFTYQYCQYSSALLGNNNLYRRLCENKNCQSTHQESVLNQSNHLSIVQAALVNALHKYLQTNGVVYDETTLIGNVTNLNSDHCPTKLELFGDDRTVVLPLKALTKIIDIDDMQRSSTNSTISFIELLRRYGITSYDRFTNQFLWKEIATVLNSHRIVRRGEINPESSIRKSNFQIVWHNPDHYVDKDDPDKKAVNWITVTEQGIHQSFDMTKVMFSRGNISEKIRFGTKLVQPDETVLDMYAGIGYFTLPALIHGRARHVYCCEWNESAIDALEHNLRQNNVHTRATIIRGDCRSTIRAQNLYYKFDRISLGLLPSSEGGWETAINALQNRTGGWLHVHGNVPNDEVDCWGIWLCVKLRSFVSLDREKSDDWITIIAHIERVKSFAPKVSHYVADVFVGSIEKFRNYSTATIPKGSAGLLCPDGNVVFCNDRYKIKPPSCALSPDGILHQKWMMSSDNIEKN